MRKARHAAATSLLVCCYPTVVEECLMRTVTGGRNFTPGEWGAKLTSQQAIEIYTSSDNALVLAERYNVTPG
jgi:hypothetical protein